MTRLALMLAIFVLGGCAAFRTTYESVESGARASVTFSKVSNYVGAPESKESPEMLVGVFEPDGDCDLHEKSRIWLEREERSRTVVMPAGRVYLGMAIIGRIGYLSQRASFLLEDGLEYVIQFNLLHGEDVSKTKYSYNYYRLEGPDRKPKPIEVDHFSICKHERAVQKD